MGCLPISQCPCRPREEGREQHGDPQVTFGGCEALGSQCCGRLAEAGAGLPSPTLLLLQPGVSVSKAA